jgi:hypothetical protein
MSSSNAADGLYLVQIHRWLFLRKAFGINPDGTPITNIKEFNDEPPKVYRSVKSFEQYNDIVRILTYWGDDAFLATADKDDPRVKEICRFRGMNEKVGYNLTHTLNSCKPSSLTGHPKPFFYIKRVMVPSFTHWKSLTPSWRFTPNKAI